MLSTIWMVNTVGLGWLTVNEFVNWHPEESVTVYEMFPAYIWFWLVDQFSVYGGVPPIIFNVAEVYPPLHKMVPTVKLSIIWVGSLMVILSVATQLFSSVRVQTYVPADRESIIWVFAH